jgi:hypothetical protein
MNKDYLGFSKTSIISLVIAVVLVAGGLAFYINKSNPTGSQLTASIAAVSDTVLPVVTSFTIPSSSSVFTVPILTLTATDNFGVTGYQVSETSTSPSATSEVWTTSAPTSYTFTSTGPKILYAFAKDVAGNVSVAKSASVSITTTTTATHRELVNYHVINIPLVRSANGLVNIGGTTYTTQQNSHCDGTNPVALSLGWLLSAPIVSTKRQPVVVAAQTDVYPFHNFQFQVWDPDAALDVANSKLSVSCANELVSNN